MEYGVFLVFAFLALMANQALTTQHVVGGSQGWDESTDFSSWASAQKFKVGDQLVFKYSSGLHSVVELASENAYKKCDLGTALDSMNTGNDVVKLNKPGTRYFACGTSGHCGQGMKLKVTTKAGSAPSNPASVAASSASAMYPVATFVLIVTLLPTNLLHFFIFLFLILLELSGCI